MNQLPIEPKNNNLMKSNSLEDDEEEHEIQRLISNNQHHMMKDSIRLTQSYSAHANLGIKNQEKKNASTVFNTDIKKGTYHDDEEDSDEEFFAEHTSLLPLRKSRSAFAGFHSLPSGHGVYTKPLLISTIVKEGINDDEGLSELIDLRKGDILNFRIDLDSSKLNETPALFSTISPEPQNFCHTSSCWSAPACSNEVEKESFSPDSSELEDVDEDCSINMKTSQKNDLRCRKESCWSAPGQFNSNITDSKDGKNKKMSSQGVADDTSEIANVENDIPMADDDRSITPFSDDDGDKYMDSFCSKKRTHHQMLLQSAAMRLCRRGSPPFAQIDLLSESEISDLEHQIASGRLVNIKRNIDDEGNKESQKHSEVDLTNEPLSTKRRILPKTPSMDDSLENIDIATASRERLLKVLRQTYQLRQNRECINCKKSDDDDHVVMKTETPLLPVLPSPSFINGIQPKVLTCRTFAGEQQYTLSYGMDQSANIHTRRRRQFSIDGSYYEDKLLNGQDINIPLESDYDFNSTNKSGNELYSPPDENDIGQHKGYIFADGAKSSSGISSSCYTSSSRSCELPECDQQQKRLPRSGPMAPTHRAQFQFIPRHADELRLDRGDAVHVNEKFDDHWCFGINLRSGQRGIFPEAHIVEIDLVDEICRSVLPEAMKVERDTFYLTMLASVEVAHHKGNDILVQAINKVCSMYQQKDEILVPQTVLMEISFRGIHVIDKRKKDIFRCPAFDYFYSLQNISFCGAHPKELRYFGFITKHPLLPRFACHVLLSNESTQSIVEAIGRAFKRSYDEYMAFAHPTEDIFLDE